MGALAKDSTIQKIIESISGEPPARTASVKNVTFDMSQFETGKINNTSGNNENGSGYYRTSGYISLLSNRWIGQLFADRPWNVFILYYDAQKTFQEYDMNMTGYCKLKNYPYCRLYFYSINDLLGVEDFILNRLKLQYIISAPAAKEYFLTNHLFNGNFEYDRNSDGIADGWILKNSPSAYSVVNGIQSVTPSAANYFLQMDADKRLEGHVIYCAYTAHTPSDYCLLAWCGTNIVCQPNTEFTRVSGLITGTASNISPRFSCGSGAVGSPIAIKDVMMIDLTEIYGAGNEPTAAVVERFIDDFYNGYVPCEYTVVYDDSDIPVDIMTRLANIQTASDEVVFTDGAVSSVKHYVKGKLDKTVTINRDKFGNIVSVGEG